jgi:hypothetical protein
MKRRKGKTSGKREKMIPTMKLSLHSFSSAMHSHNVVPVLCMCVENGEDIPISKVVARISVCCRLNPS